MQACRAYYADGRFIPLEPLDIPEGSQAIITVIDFFCSLQTKNEIQDVCLRQMDALERFRDMARNCDEPIPEFESIKLSEIEI